MDVPDSSEASFTQLANRVPEFESERPSRPARLHDAEPRLFESFRSRTWVVLGCAILLGVLADILFTADRLGVNVFVWTGALLLAESVLAPARSRSVLGALFRGAAAVFAACVAWHDSGALVLLNCCMVLLCLALAGGFPTAAQLRNAAVMQPVLAAIQFGANALRGFVSLVLQEIGWSELSALLLGGRARALFRAMLISVPLLLVFGALFCSADARFQQLVSNTIAWFPTISPGDLALIFAATWVSAGVLRQFAYVRAAMVEDGAPADTRSLGSVELSITLVLLNALFLVFVLTQASYFFGGMQHVLSTAHLTLAQYARRGFFELVTVAALVLPLLLAFDWYTARLRAGEKRQFRLLAFALVLQLFVIMGSALHRMFLYRASYGLTELRYFVTAFMLMLGAVFVWFCMTVLCGQRRRFVAGALVLGFASAFVLQATNPVARIARTNLHTLTGEHRDLHYLFSLGADAIPVLVEEVPGLSGGVTDDDVAKMIVAQSARFSMVDWRTWNYARVRANRLVEQFARERGVKAELKI